MTVLNMDFETKSRIDLKKRGLDVYAKDPSTKVLMMSWAIDDAPVKLWVPHEGKPPVELREALLDPDVEKHAWNAPFERTIFREALRINVPGKWRDTMVKARYLSLPGSLYDAGRIVGLPEDKQKLATGRKLINLFCKPRTEKQRKGKAGSHEWNDWNTHPEEWAQFCEYCIIDTESERALSKRFARYEMPEHEWMLYELDQRINARGLPVDLLFVENAIAMVKRAKMEIIKELREVCGMSNVTGTAAFLAWAKERGYPFGDLRKATVERALNPEQPWNIDPVLEKALRLRSDATKTSTAKYTTLLSAQEGGVIRNAFVFYGAQRTGRFAGQKFQPQNLKRPDKNLEKKLAYVTDLIREDDYDTLDFEFSYMMRVLSSVIRSSIRARPGKKLVVSDLNAIENRVLGWLANCKRTLDVFRKGLDPYKAFGVHLFNKAYDELTPKERNESKPAVLGAGYRLGGGGLGKNPKTGDIVKTGLWGYAESMHIKLTQEQATQAVAVFREIHPAIVQFWYALEEAAYSAVVRRVPKTVGFLTFDYHAGFMRIRLPSGRHLYYLRPSYRKVKFIGADGPYYKEVLHYEGVNQVTKQWGLLKTHGGKLAENVTQAVARDVLCVGLVRAEKDDFNVILHVHDEIGCEEDEDDDYHTHQRLGEIMSQPIKWAPGLPLGAAGYTNTFYKKD